MLLHITHETRYRYLPAVVNAHHVVNLKPVNRAGCQRLLDHSLVIYPSPQSQRETQDVFGNSRTFFSLQTVHPQLRVVAKSRVLTRTPRALHAGAAKASSLSAGWPWEQVREAFCYRAGARFDSANEFLFASSYAPVHEAFADYARSSFQPGRPLLEAAHSLMQHIYQSMAYAPDSTQVHTPALDALRQGKGVCQDFAHIMVACLRSLGLPARYVSGYLLTHPPPGKPRLIGSDASHAWASVYSPEHRHWFDFDPTNNRAPGEDYVTLAVGRDFLDVSPMRGVIRGGANHVLSVEVTVEPLNEAKAVDRRSNMAESVLLN